MTDSYCAETTGLILVDPFNDFLSESGKNWESVKEVALEVGVVENLTRLAILFDAMHRQAEAEEFAGWKAVSGTHEAMAEIHPDLKPEAGDVMALKHWMSSGFTNTDLDFLLKQHGVDHVVVAGMAANTCVEATGRYALELDYHVT